MALAGKAEAILARLEEGAEQEGVDIVGVEVVGVRDHPVVRVRIDNLDGSAIDMEQVVSHTPWVSQVVEDLDPFVDGYELEVSSPGLDRPLRRERDFARFAGERVEVSLTAMVAGRMKGTGVLLGAADGQATVDLDGQEWTFGVDQVKSARIKPDFAAVFAQAAKREKLSGDPRDAEEPAGESVVESEGQAPVEEDGRASLGGGDDGARLNS